MVPVMHSADDVWTAEPFDHCGPIVAGATLESVSALWGPPDHVRENRTFVDCTWRHVMVACTILPDGTVYEVELLSSTSPRVGYHDVKLWGSFKVLERKLAKIDVALVENPIGGYKIPGIQLWAEPDRKSVQTVNVRLSHQEIPL